MIRLWKSCAITLLALFTLAPIASARRKKVTIYYQPPSSTTGYEVRAERTGPPVYTYTVPESKNEVYVYEAAPPRTMGQVKITAPAKDSTVWIDGEFAGATGHIMQLGLEAGSHDVELRDPQGKKMFSGSVDVVAGQTTEIKPD